MFFDLVLIAVSFDGIGWWFVAGKAYKMYNNGIMTSGCLYTQHAKSVIDSPTTVVIHISTHKRWRDLPCRLGFMPLPLPACQIALLIGKKSLGTCCTFGWIVDLKSVSET